MSQFGIDTRATPIEKHVVLDIDNRFREASFVGGIVGGIFSTVAFSGLLLTPAGQYNKALYSVRVAVI